MSTDVIEREILINAPVERVYEAITDPTKIISWFPDAVEGALAVGESPIFTFEGHGKAQLYIEAAKPHEYFAYRWVPGARSHFVGDVLSVPTTLVEFFISEEGTGTKVILKESGFDSLPDEMKQEAFKDNSGGWSYMFGRLEKLFATS
jgi:uncharacterized protein YndB with AHSA1/START domain